MTATLNEQLGIDGRAATAAAVAPALATERKILPPGNVAVIRRHTDNSHRIFFCVQIGEIVQYPYTLGSTLGETEARLETFEAVERAKSLGEIDDHFVVGRGEKSPSLIGIKSVNPEIRYLVAEAFKDPFGNLGDVTFKVPVRGRYESLTLDSSFLEDLGDLKQGLIFDPIASQIFYDIQQRKFPPRLITPKTEPAA